MVTSGVLADLLEAAAAYAGAALGGATAKYLTWGIMRMG
jgi:hypothetical protein